MSSHASDAAPPTSQGTAKVVVIGFGSPIRGDDAWGPLVADRLADHIDSPQVVVHSRHILTAEMAADLQDATLVLFLDAAIEGEAGQITQHLLEPRPHAPETVTHSLDPRGLLAWTQALYGSAPPALLLSTRAVSLEYAHYRLTPPVQATVAPLVQRVCELVAQHLRNGWRPVAST